MNLTVTITDENSKVLSVNTTQVVKDALTDDGEGMEKDSFVVEQVLKYDVNADIERCFKLYYK